MLLGDITGVRIPFQVFGQILRCYLLVVSAWLQERCRVIQLGLRRPCGNMELSLCLVLNPPPILDTNTGRQCT